MTVRKIKSIGDIPYPIDVGADALSPLLTAGAALGITGDGPTDSAAWLQRTSTSDGPTTAKSIHGRTLRWNQIAPVPSGRTSDGVTFTKDVSAGTLTANGTATADTYASATFNAVAGHKYIMRGCPAGGSASTYYDYLTGSGFHNMAETGGGIIDSPMSNGNASYVVMVKSGTTVTNLMFRPQLFDLTAMFGAGSEPSTVAEFEALYPASYYPYDAGSLLPVSMTGIETVGSNIWGGDAFKADFLDLASSVTEGTNAYGRYIDLPASAGSGSPAVFTGPFKPNTRYTIYFRIGRSVTATSTNLNVTYTDGTTSNIARHATTSDGSPEVLVFVTNASKSLAAVNAMNSSGHSYLYYDGCGLFEGVHTAEEFQPYWTEQRTIDTATYFPNGMRSAGTVYDELTETQVITRIGERAYQSGDESDATVVTDGTVTHYALATPTTVEIDPPLNLAYRTAAGGTERVIVPTGELSAPPTLVTAQGYTAESLRDAALSAIAPVENGLASTNYGVGSYLVHGGQLCRVTTAIATGESISIGTNVTATTVMAEILSLVQ